MKSWMGLLSLISTTGCAVGYGVGYKSHSLGTGDKSSNLTYENSKAKVSGAFQELRIIDSTGILLAGLVSSGRQYTARQDAIANAQYQRPDNEGNVRVEYSYKPMPILAGLITDLRIRIPLGETDLEVPSGSPVMKNGLDYWEADLRSEVFTFRPVKSLPLVSSAFLGMVASNVNTDVGQNVDVELDYFSLDLTAGVATSYVITPNLLATGRVAVGWISPLLGGLVGGSLFHPSGEVELGWRPINGKVGVMVSGTASLAREWIVEPRAMTTARVGLGVTLTFGDQRPKAVRKEQDAQQQQAGATDVTATGSVCKNDAPACKQIEETAPAEVKTAFQACGRASIEADRTGNAGTQPQTCRDSALAIAAYYKANETTLSPEQKKLVDTAAAGTFSLAALGFRVTNGENSAEQCEMTEQMFNHIVRSIPEQAAQVNPAVDACRAKFTCQTNAEGVFRCTAK